MKNNEKLNVVCFMGAASCGQLCMHELQMKVGGTILEFNYKLYLEAIRSRMLYQRYVTRWIKNNVGEHKTIICAGINPNVAQKIFAKAFPEKDIRLLIWEVHHDELSEAEIMKERSLRLLIDGILEDGDIAISRKIKPNANFIKSTPLATAIFHLRKKKFEIDKFLHDLELDLQANNFVTCQDSIKCREGFNSTQRNKSIKRLKELMNTEENRKITHCSL